MSRRLPGLAYSRACEYTCDRIGAYCQPHGAIAGLLVLAAGKQLHAHVDVKEFAAQADTENNFWIRRAEVMSSRSRLKFAGIDRRDPLHLAGVPLILRQPLPI